MEQAGGGGARTDTMEIFWFRTFGLSNFRERYPRLFSDFLLHQQPLPDGPMEIEAVSGLLACW